MSDLDVKKFYVSLRDKHLSQLMEISGKAAFTTLSIIVALFFGLDDIGRINRSDALVKYYLYAGTLGIGLLTWGTVKFSRFHTKAIVALERRIRGANQTTLNSDDDIYRILPLSGANFLIFLGVVILIICSLGVAFSYDPPPATP